MEWIILTIFTSNAGIDSVCNMLYAMDITGVEIEDEQEFKEFLEENKKYWDYVDDDLLKEKSGETKVKIAIEEDEDPWDDIDDELTDKDIEEIDKVDTDFIK